MARQLRKYQQTAREQIWKRLIEDDEPSTLLVMATGCHRAGQKIRLYNGQLIQVENIWPGCLLMGPDSCPRRVLCLCRGRGEMVRILPVKGRSWVVNIDHVLTLVKTPRSATDSRACRRGGDIVDVTVRDWLSWPKSRKHVYKLFRVAVHYPGRNHLPINPYFMGTLLGDGSILARVGITSKDFAVAGELFAQAAAHGLGVASSPAGGKSATFFATNGRDGRQSHPCRIGFKRHRKRRQKKNVLRTGFSVERLGVEDYTDSRSTVMADICWTISRSRTTPGRRSPWRTPRVIFWRRFRGNGSCTCRTPKKPFGNPPTNSGRCVTCRWKSSGPHSMRPGAAGFFRRLSCVRPRTRFASHAACAASTRKTFRC